jgi:hypothetical protein
MKDVLLLHDNARPHTSLRTLEAVAKMGWTLLPEPAHSPVRAPSDYRLFDHVKDALRGRHFADENDLKQSFRSVLRSRGREFYNIGKQSFTQRWHKCIENDGDFVAEGGKLHICKRCMNYPCKFNCYSNYIFWKEWKHYFHTAPRVCD